MKPAKGTPSKVRKAKEESKNTLPLKTRGKVSSSRKVDSQGQYKREIWNDENFKKCY